jgi:TRAP-type mannitol/chloroaromatic compound transport system permease small subunit
MNLLVRRRVLWDYLAGALWVLPTISVVVFLAAGALLSRVSISNHSPLAFQGTADDARNVLIVVWTTMITVTGLVFALTNVALQIASGHQIRSSVLYVDLVGSRRIWLLTLAASATGRDALFRRRVEAAIGNRCPGRSQ